MVAVLNWSLNHWWVFLWLMFFGVFDWVREFVIGVAEALSGIGGRKHRQRLELERARAKTAKAAAKAAEMTADRALPAAPCRHRNVVGVRDRMDNVVAWLCKGCDERLPANFSVYEEDL